MSSRQDASVITPFVAGFATQSGGWLPMNPLTAPVALGEFGQWHDGAFVGLGNIADLTLVQPVDASEPQALSEHWHGQSGVAQEYGGLSDELQGFGGEGSGQFWQKRVLGFDGVGSYVFHGRTPQGQWLMNWTEFAPDITLKLTQSAFGFRDVWVITAVATVAEWGLIVSARSGAELVMVCEDESDWAGLSHASTRLVQSRGLAQLTLGTDQTGYFFQAKKLVLSQHKYDQLLQELLQQPASLGGGPLDYWLSQGLMSRIPGQEINAASCLETFDWATVTYADLHPC